MSRLNLHCELCGRRQAHGLLSGAAWGQIQLSPEAVLRACPNCRQANPDWEDQLRVRGGAANGGQSSALTEGRVRP